MRFRPAHTGLKRLVIAGGVGANAQLRASLNAAAAKKKFKVYYPELEFCTDNGAMIAFAGAMRLKINPDAAKRTTVSTCGHAGRWKNCASSRRAGMVLNRCRPQACANAIPASTASPTSGIR
jgi:hypothetical protein